MVSPGEGVSRYDPLVSAAVSSLRTWRGCAPADMDSEHERTQYRYLLIPTTTIAGGAGARATLVAVLASLGVGGALFGPALIALLVLHTRGVLDGDHVQGGQPVPHAHRHTTVRRP